MQGNRRQVVLHTSTHTGVDKDEAMMQDQDGRRRVAEAEERTKRAETPSAKSKQSRAEIPSAKNKQSENLREGQRDGGNIGEDAQQSASKR